MEVKKLEFPATNYVQEATKKTQIVIHHTVSGDGISGDMATFKASKDKVAVHYIIDREGSIYRLFDEKYWAYHLGLKTEHFSKLGLSYKNLNKVSIGIELDSWGPVLLHGGKYYPVKWDSILKKYIPNTNAKPIMGYPEEYCTSFRGHRYYEKYTTLQLNSLKELLVNLCKTHNIPSMYKGSRFWNVNKDALNGEAGIWGHCSFRIDKSDPHMQTELVNVLKSL
jgi:N-acetyl-anhydromuramyl-L-alanine amidase AmpD